MGKSLRASLLFCNAKCVNSALILHTAHILSLFRDNSTDAGLPTSIIEGLKVLKLVCILMLLLFSYRLTNLIR